MKFRAIMTDAMCMRRFSLALTTLTKLGKQCMVFLDANHLCFVIFEEGLPRVPVAWCNLKQSFYFESYYIEGLEKDHNQISLNFSSELFAKAIAPLKTPTSMTRFKMSLAQKNVPVLIFEMETNTVLQCPRKCMYDVPVTVVPKKVWINLGLTKEMKFDLCIHMPNIKKLKSTLEKMRNMGSQVIIEATNDGHLVFKIEKGTTIIGTYFNRLQVDSSTTTDPDYWFKVRADFKQLIRFLSIEALSPRKIICNIVDNKLIFMHVIHNNVTFDFFISGIEE